MQWTQAKIAPFIHHMNMWLIFQSDLIAVSYCILLKLSLLSFDISAVSEPHFLKPALFTFESYYHIPVHMVNFSFNLSNYFIAKAPSNPLLNSPLKRNFRSVQHWQKKSLTSHLVSLISHASCKNNKQLGLYFHVWWQMYYDCSRTRAKCVIWIIIWIVQFEWSFERRYFGPCVRQIISRCVIWNAHFKWRSEGVF